MSSVRRMPNKALKSFAALTGTGEACPLAKRYAKEQA